MKYVIAFLLSILATAASAEGVAYLDEPVGAGRVNVLLSDQVMEPEECNDGKHGYLGRVSIISPFGVETMRYDGCWRVSYDGNTVLFFTTYNGMPEVHRFSISRFTPLQ